MMSFKPSWRWRARIGEIPETSSMYWSHRIIRCGSLRPRLWPSGSRSRNGSNEKSSLLSDAHPGVRAAAASALLWDEPIAAEPALLVAAADEDDDVACDALDTLRYYQSTTVFDTLLKVRAESASLRRFDMATRSLDDIVDSATDGVKGMRADNSYGMQIRERLSMYEEHQRRVNSTVAYHPPSNPSEELEPPSAGALAQQLSSDQPKPTNNREAQSFVEFRETLEDLGGEWQARYALLRSFDPTGMPAEGQTSLASLICTHSDPMVRSIGCAMLAKLDRVSDLVALLEDATPHVVKSARYSLRFVEPTDDVAELVIRPVLNGEIAGTQASEAIETWTASPASARRGPGSRRASHARRRPTGIGAGQCH